MQEFGKLYIALIGFLGYNMQKIDLIRERMFTIIDENLKDVYKNEMKILLKEFEEEITKEVKKYAKTIKHRNTSRKFYS